METKEKLSEEDISLFQSTHPGRKLRNRFSSRQPRPSDNHIINQDHTITFASALGVDLNLGIGLANQVLSWLVDELVLLPFALLQGCGGGTVAIFVDADLEVTVVGFGGLAPRSYGEGFSGGADGCGLLDEGEEVLGHGYLAGES